MGKVVQETFLYQYDICEYININAIPVYHRVS